ncbi:MAG TPA: DinB family protein [Terriglobia bacterium]|nr:DinB family protein [Terriglobia bacterium]
MESLDSFRHLFKYDHWANQESLRSISSLSTTNERALKIAGHIVGAQRVWLGRLEAPGGAPPAPWPFMTLEETCAAFSELHERWNLFLSSLGPERLDEDIVHRNTKGAEFRVPIRDILMQLVLHGAYHRGQIAAEIRGAGGNPSATDYIVYVRRHGN